MQPETIGRRRLFWAAVVLAVLILALAGLLVRAGASVTEAVRRRVHPAPAQPGRAVRP
jgi:hypothetical protein